MQSNSALDYLAEGCSPQQELVLHIVHVFRNIYGISRDGDDYQTQVRGNQKLYIISELNNGMG